MRGMLFLQTFLTLCPAAFLATKLSGTPTAVAIFCSAADKFVNWYNEKFRFRMNTHH